jgi:hypothetical protein
MLSPHDILDPQDSFVEQRGIGVVVKAVVRAAAGLIRFNATRLLWLTGAVLYALGTWAIVATTDTRGIALQNTQASPVSSFKQAPQLPKPSPSSPSTLELPPSHTDQATPELAKAAPSKSDNERSQQGDLQSEASTSVQVDKLELIDPAALGTPHAVAVEQTKESRAKSLPERVRVASTGNIYSGPSAADTLLGTAQVGAEAEVSSRDAQWVQIVDPASGKMGWIHSRHVVSVSDGGDESPTNETNLLSSEQQAALADDQEAVPIAP